MSRALRRSILFIPVAIPLLLAMAEPASAGAGRPHESAVDQVARSYEIPVTDPINHTDLPAVLLVKSATLNTQNPDGSGVASPAGQIYLTLQATCGPIQSAFGEPNWGRFFSNMTPLPATALRYVTASGRSYAATRTDPLSQTNNELAASDDGLLDATYYFTVPITNRAGTLVIEPTRTLGVPYTGFVGGAPVPLVVGGPTKVALHFPKRLTVAISPKPIPPNSPGTPGAASASAFNFASTLLGLMAVGILYLALNRRRRRQTPPQVVIHNHLAPDGPPPPRRTESAEPAFAAPAASPPPADFASPVTLGAHAVRERTLPPLRVNVLGRLEFDPVYAPASDPVRAILAYLALSDRPLSLDEIQNAIWPLTDRGNDIKRPAMRNYMVEARKVVGDRHLPTASGRPGYQLVDVTTDWSEFQDLVSESQRVAKPAAANLQREALSLVRGVPFAADTSRYFTWAFSAPVVYGIVDAVTSLAHATSRDRVLTGDLAGAEWSLRHGLLCDPASLTLWEDLTDVLLASADESLLALHWKAASLVLDSKDVAGLQAREHG